MILLYSVALGFIATVTVSSQVHAIPSFTWSEPWNVSLTTTQCSIRLGIPVACPEFGSRAFGASATSDGQILNTTDDDDIAVAKSQFTAVPGIPGDFGFTGVAFSRTFRLTDSPAGWAVGFAGVLNGQLSVSAAHSVSSFVSANIFLPSTFPVLLGWQEFLADSRSIAINEHKNQVVFLPDGDYTVSSNINTQAALFRAGMGRASSDFFSSFSVSITASPIPEPSTLLLVMTGLFAIVWTRYLRGRSIKRLN